MGKSNKSQENFTIPVTGYIKIPKPVNGKVTITVKQLKWLISLANLQAEQQFM